MNLNEYLFDAILTQNSLKIFVNKKVPLVKFWSRHYYRLMMIIIKYQTIGLCVKKAVLLKIEFIWKCKNKKRHLYMSVTNKTICNPAWEKQWDKEDSNSVSNAWILAGSEWAALVTRNMMYI